MGKMLFRGNSNNGLYPLHLHRIAPNKLRQPFALIGERVGSPTWHQRLWHLAFSILQCLVSQQSLPLQGSLKENMFCASFPLDKSTRSPFLVVVFYFI